MFWCFNKRAALFLAMNLSVGSLVNQTLKNTFCVYRPWIKNPSLIPYTAAMESATGYSFPSGHTQIAASEFLSLAVWQKKRIWIVLSCIMMTLLVMFTRMYLGVHTPQDVLVSLAVSCAVICIDAKLFTWIEKGANRDLLFFAAGMVITAIALGFTTLKAYPMDYAPDGTLLVDPKNMITDCYLAAGCVTGFLCGWVLEKRFLRFSTEKSSITRFLRALFGGLSLYLYAEFAREPFTQIHTYWGEFLFIAIAFMYILFVYPAVFVWAEKHIQVKKNQYI